MKKIFFLLLAASGTLSATAQNQAAGAADSTKPAPKFTHDRDMPRWAVDINLMAGLMTQDYTTGNTNANYLNGIGINQGSLSFKNGTSFGFDAQLGYFFGKSCHWGIGTGLVYMSQHGDAKLDNFTAQYEAGSGDAVYRQVVTGYNLKEQLNITNLNIPLFLKYKTRFSRHWGFSADAGLLFNVQMSNAYKTDASFDYEAIIKQNPAFPLDGSHWVYDNSVTPDPSDLLITKAHYLAAHPGGDVAAYFADERAHGYNVGLGVKPNSNSGTVSYTTGSVGFMLRPTMTYYVSDNVALNFGLYYTYQSFKHTVPAGYMLTNNMGDYNSSLNTVTRADVQTYGVNVGMRFMFGKLKDSDGDGIPDKHDKCPTVWGLAQFQGCPDTDGDGIQDSEDSCVMVKGLVQFHGCPDTDGDGIPDKDDACPTQAGPKALNGCPDRDGDGIADKDDACPDKAGPAKFHGCPDTDGDGVPDNLDKCPDVAGPADNQGCPLPPPPPPAPAPEMVITPILFDVNKESIHRFSYPVLDEAAKKLNETPDGYIVVDGYTDNTGKPVHNKRLSLKRANAVKRYLVKHGVDPKKVHVIGHGSKDPVADNTTKEGRAKNRRAIMKITVNGSK